MSESFEQIINYYKDPSTGFKNANEIYKHFNGKYTLKHIKEVLSKLDVK